MLSKAKILIVEDQFIEAHALERMLVRAGYHVCDLARSVQDAVRIINREDPDLVLLDIFLQGRLTGIDLAKTLRDKQIPFVYLSANNNKKIFDEAKATQPNGFLVKPFREKDVLNMLDIAWYIHREKSQKDGSHISGTRNVPRQISTRAAVLLGKNSLMTQVFNQIEAASKSAISVLILGESGTGKELVAKEIHRSSKRKDKPFIIVNCAALPATLIESELFGHERGAFTGAVEKRIGKFEQADGGTIFLDEIGELPIEMQAKLLRTLQEKEIEPISGKLKKIDVHIIAATNRNLEDEIGKGRFRIDLYFRLSVFPILLPPLRERRSDIPLLTDFFIKKYCKESGRSEMTLSDDVLKKLTAYHWPGNVRELENLIFKSVVVNKTDVIEHITLSNIAPDGTESKFNTIAENERNYILAVLNSCGWRVSGPSGAAAILDINVSTLNSKMKKLNIKRPA